MRNDATANATGQPAKVSAGSLLLVAIVAALLSAGGATAVFYLLAKRMGLPSIFEAKPADSKTITARTRQIPFDPMLVNLADGDGQAYLRVSVVLSVLDESEKPVKEKVDPANPGAGNAAIRDAILSVVGAERSSDLLYLPAKWPSKRNFVLQSSSANPLLKLRTFSLRNSWCSAKLCRIYLERHSMPELRQSCHRLQRPDHRWSLIHPGPCYPPCRYA